MDIITEIHRMQQWADTARARNRRVGLVPTMGYLHAGHLSLVHEARRRSDLTVASVFVNPLQFGAGEDLERYPRDPERDAMLLSKSGTDVLFLPDARALYPQGFQTTVAVDAVTRGLCGASRPMHFRGVTTVVAKLFNIVKPHLAVFGRKDFQQLVTIRRMVADLNFDVEIVGAPIVREADGLAMSSRNAYLSPRERAAALCLSRALWAAAARVEQGETECRTILAAVRRVIAEEPLARLDYAAVVDPDTLEDVPAVNNQAVVALAVRIGKTRLIDNCVLRTESTDERREQDAPRRSGMRSRGALDHEI